MRHAGNQTHHYQDACGNRQRLGRGEHLAIDLGAHVLGGRDTGHHDGRRSRQQQRRNLRHQTVTDGQQYVDPSRLGKAQVMLGDTDRQTADHVDEQNQQTGNRVAADKLAGTVHGAVEICLLGDFLATQLGLLLVDDTGVQIGIDRHLLARHRIQGKARAHLGDPPGALGHHHEVDDHQDREDHQTDHVVAADHHLAEGLDHLARGIAPFMTVKQHHTGGGHVQRQPQQGCDQQNGGENREIQGPQGIGTDQQHDQRKRNIEGKQHVQQERGHRQHHHAEHHQQQNGHPQTAMAQASEIAAHVPHYFCAIDCHALNIPDQIFDAGYGLPTGYANSIPDRDLLSQICFCATTAPAPTLLCSMGVG